MMNSSKRWVVLFILLVMFLLAGGGAATVVVDPYFHYHKPLSRFQYVIENQRYQNNGIVKHFDYDAIITGTSMSENFKTSEFDEIFGVNSVKVPFSGGSYREINNNLIAAVGHNPDIKMILRCMDYDEILYPADYMNYDEEDYPIYLYDDLLYNDVEYIFNKSILFEETYSVVEYTREGGITTDFDTYGNWMQGRTFGKEALDALYTRAEKTMEPIAITDADYKNITENITQNVTNLASEYPEIQFYLFFSPYSIYFWDSLHQAGTLERQLDAEKYAIELMLQYDNIHLFSFFTDYGMICNLDNYKDTMHYDEDINSQILLRMKEGINELTKDNYEEYCDWMREFYGNYDYDGLFE